MNYGNPPGGYPGLNHPAYDPMDYRRVRPQIQERAVGVQTLTVPILLAVFACFSIAGMAYAAATNLGEIRSSIVELNTKVQDRFARLDDKLGGYIQDINQRFQFVQSQIDARTADRYSRTDHELFCSRTELKNPGFKCGDPSATREAPPALPDLSVPPLGPSSPSSPLGAWRVVGSK